MKSALAVLLITVLGACGDDGGADASSDVGTSDARQNGAPQDAIQADATGDGSNYDAPDVPIADAFVTDASVDGEPGGDAGALLTSECLARGEDQITVLSGPQGERLRVDAPSDHHAYDLRGAVWEREFTGEFRAVGISDRLDGACVVGGVYRGTQARDMAWDNVKNTDAVRFPFDDSASIGRVTAEGLYVDNVGDAFEPPRYQASAGLGYSWTLRSSYFRHVRDDVIENDACHPGLVEDVLVDASFVFLSVRPGSGNHIDNGAEAPVIRVQDSLIHVGSEALGGRLWKWPGGSSSCTPTPVLDVRDTILRVDRDGANLTFPEGTFTNVTLVWLGGGEYPEPLPPGVTTTADVSVWDEARGAWLLRHGCDAGGEACAQLIEEPAM